MRKARWLARWKDSFEKPSIYHCIKRAVNRTFVFGDEEREQFRIFMRMYENFSGCRVLSYCVMSNHFHILLEVPPMPEAGLSDADFLQRLRALYPENYVAEVASELAEARSDKEYRLSFQPSELEIFEDEKERAAMARRYELNPALFEGNWFQADEIRGRYLHRMHDLSEYFKGLLIRFTRWFNRKHQRKGTLWEERFKSVIVESGTAARTMAAYIDLNPVRAGMVEDPANYRWSSYGEAVGGGRKGNGKRAREGLVRAITSDTDTGFDASEWKNASRRYRRLLGIALERKTLNAKVDTSQRKGITQNDAEALESGNNETVLPELSIAKMLRCRVRYFTDGAVIGSKEFVNEAFAGARERFSEKRKDGARKLRGSGKAAAGALWSVRDLRVEI